jgi:hypothetical protein
MLCRVSITLEGVVRHANRVGVPQTNFRRNVARISSVLFAARGQRHDTLRRYRQSRFGGWCLRISVCGLLLNRERAVRLGGDHGAQMLRRIRIRHLSNCLISIASGVPAQRRPAKITAAARTRMPPVARAPAQPERAPGPFHRTLSDRNSPMFLRQKLG